MNVGMRWSRKASLVASALTLTTGLAATTAAAAPRPHPSIDLPRHQAPKASHRSAALPGGGVQIVQDRTNLCLTVRAANAGNGAAVSVDSCNGNPEQLWAFDAQGELRNGLGTCLDNTDFNGYNGGGVETWACLGQTAVQWHVNGLYIVNANGHCLDLSAGNPAPGATVQLYNCNTDGNQGWRIG
jgi:Ricin-type beta-trefoil lectin domain